VVPDVLVMTATPIRAPPRCSYGDPDKSELREMPPGRTPIATKVVGPERSTRSRCGSASRRGGGRSPGLRRVSASRGEGRDRGQGRDCGVRTAAAGGAACGLLLHGQLPSKRKP
jgi:ATP-dependent DNA helicase RecG